MTWRMLFLPYLNFRSQASTVVGDHGIKSLQLFCRALLGYPFGKSHQIVLVWLAQAFSSPSLGIVLVLFWHTTLLWWGACANQTTTLKGLLYLEMSQGMTDQEFFSWAHILYGYYLLLEPPVSVVLRKYKLQSHCHWPPRPRILGSSSASLKFIAAVPTVVYYIGV